MRLAIEIQMFQSLKGILVNFNFTKHVFRPKEGVSIPQRDFGEFQPSEVCENCFPSLVSIPQRDFGEFQLFRPSRQTIKGIVSIPQRDFGEFQPMAVVIPANKSETFSFQSLKGILVNFNCLFM